MSQHPFDYKVVRELTPEQLFGVIDDWVNTHSSNISNAGFITKALNGTHRTLQQNFVGMFFNVLVQYGQQHQGEFSFDARNEDAVMLCRKLAKLVEDGELETHLRYI